MIRKNPHGDLPEIDNSAYIDPAALVIGKVKIGKSVFIGPGAVVRADEPGSSIIIKDDCNVQDRVGIHALGNTSVEIGRSVSLSHGCIVHGPCKIGRQCFIGFGAVVFKSSLGDGVIVEHLAVVEGVSIPSKKAIPNGVVVDPKSRIKDLECASGELVTFSQKVIKANLNLVKGYKKM